MKTPVRVLLLVILAFVAGVGFSSLSWPQAGAQDRSTHAVGLGLTAAAVIQRIGNPQKINFDASTQVWFYRNKAGVLEPRYDVNQGLVVRIRGTPDGR